MTIQTRSLSAIAHDIKNDWQKVNYAAVPYLDAMLELESINDNYYHDTAHSVVAYFLANASSYRGEKAKHLKSELKLLQRRA
jgi:hypothetical protein